MVSVKAHCLDKQHKFVRNLDFFGHPVRFRFDDKGSEHRTFAGGMLSLFVRFLIFVYLGLLIKRVILHEADRNTTSVFVTDYEELGEVAFERTYLQPFVTLYDSRNYRPIEYNNETKRYFYVDWVAVEQNSRVIEVNKTASEAQPCGRNNTVEGFSDTILADDQNFTRKLLCPPTLSDFKLANNTEKDVSQVVQLQVKRCQHRPEEPWINCASNNEIDEYIKHIMVYSKVYEQQIDFTHRGGPHEPQKPILNATELISVAQLSAGVLEYQMTDLVLNDIRAFDSKYASFIADHFEFFDIGDHRAIRQSMNSNYPATYLVQTFQISPFYKEHERHIYGLFGLIGDLGGVFELLVSLMGLLAMPLNEMHFTLKALQKMYLAKTKDTNLFLRPDEKEKLKKEKRRMSKFQKPIQKGISFSELTPAVLDSLKQKEEANLNYPIIMTMGKRRRLFLREFCLTTCCFKRSSKPWISVTDDDKYSMLLKKGRQMINQDLSIEKLIQTVRDMRIFLKSRQVSEKTQYDINNNPRNFVALDDLNDYLYQDPTDSDVSIEVELLTREFKAEKLKKKDEPEERDNSQLKYLNVEEQYSLGHVSSKSSQKSGIKSIQKQIREAAAVANKQSSLPVQHQKKKPPQTRVIHSQAGRMDEESEESIERPTPRSRRSKSKSRSKKTSSHADKRHENAVDWGTLVEKEDSSQQPSKKTTKSSRKSQKETERHVMSLNASEDSFDQL